ncbi:MAG: biotin/lipoyl-binding protein [Rubrivivax sp.]|nr:biotin/lipoyl-binding protein [Rubrivivax sp.]
MSETSSLLSPLWYRVAHMKPQLRSGVRVARQHSRGRTWYLLSDPLSGRHHRFNDAAFRLVALCNGQRSIDEIWALRVDAEGDAAPTQAQAIEVFAQAFAANLFVGNVAPDARAVVHAHQRTRAARRRNALNPLALRVPLADPDALLTRHVARVAWLFGARAQALIWSVVALGALLLALNADAFAAYARAELGGGHMLLALWLAYPLIKALHEAAHAFAVKAYGGEVHEIGVSLLLLTPVPYVDASAATAFSDKRKRIVVGGAGIAVEAVLGTAALVLWLLLQDGWARELAFAVAFIGGVSTLLVNANPLLRLDGYHVLCDALELPNLAPRSQRWWQQFLKHRVLRLPQARPLHAAAGERAWLIAHAPLAFVYRAVLVGALALLLAAWHPAAGLLVLALGAWSMLLRPLALALRWGLQSPELSGARTRAALAGLALATLAALLLFALPLPDRSHAPGLVWLPDDALVRPAVDGFVQELAVQDGEIVAAGTLLLRLSNEALQLELGAVQARLLQMQIERDGQYEIDLLRSQLAADELARLSAQRQELQERVAALDVRAAIAGRAVIPPQLVPGAHVQQGQTIAQVLPPGAPLVRALVDNDDIEAVRTTPGAITVALARRGGLELPARLAGGVPRASTALPSAALGEGAGGFIATDAADASGRTAREPRFSVDLRLAAGGDARVGTLALVTFEHGRTHLAELLARLARRAFLRHFEQ